MLRSVAAVAVAAAAVAGCSGGKSDNANPGGGFQVSPDTPAAKGTIPSVSWSLYAEPQTLDYLYAWDYPINTVLANVCEQFLRTTPDMKIEPGLATSYTNPDPLTWVYNLREGVTFHDGTPMTSADAVASLKRHLDPELASAWGTAFRNVASIDATGPLQVTIKLTKPDALLNSMLAASPGTVESAASIEKAGKDYGNPQGGVNCTGPFALDKWTPGDSITLKKNPKYWDAKLVAKADAFKFVFIQDPSARVNALVSGSVDGGYTVPSSAYGRLRNTPNGKLYFGPNSGSYLLAVTNLQGTMGDLKLRQALSLAIDRTGLIKAAAGGVANEAKGLTPIGAWGLAPEKAPTYFATLPPVKQDLTAAKKLVADAGGGAGKKIVLATSSLAPEITVSANAIQAAGKSIGLDIELKTVTPDAYTALFTDPEARKGIDLVVTSGYTNTPDPLEFYESMVTGAFANYGNYSNPEYDKLYEQAAGTADPAARSDLTAKLQDIALRDLTSIPLFEPPHNVFMNKRITGAAPGIAQLYWPWAATVGAAG
ncbi:ABC transporter substrate-binding protein [Embleya sp. NPDC050154]|uniref:ABC transporter substrate-binding protein n=1 Tax=Embleya sp. NPDC050154 TaxID=3363988 RepID=UPI0037B77444